MKISVTTEAIAKIKQMIVAGEVKPGDKLPRERELAEGLGLSRSSLREAVRALAALNVLEVRQGDGTYVGSLSPDELLDVVGFAMDLVEDPTLLEVFEVRKLLETAATSMAAIKIDPENLAALRSCMARMDGATDIEELVRADEDFHHIVATATGNSVLVALLDNLSSRTVRARIWRGMMEDSALEKTKQWHHAILRGIEAGDPQTAQAADLMHIVEGEAWLRGTFGIDAIGEPKELEPSPAIEIGGQ
jgi:GntR family transcriptional regulator, transcriptional repressor for pyruvate dehydrogenase complex